MPVIVINEISSYAHIQNIFNPYPNYIRNNILYLIFMNLINYVQFSINDPKGNKKNFVILLASFYVCKASQKYILCNLRVQFYWLYGSHGTVRWLIVRDG